MSISVSGSQITFNDASVQTTAATGFGFKNRIINGAMMIDQRNAGASVTATSNPYTIDRWRAVITQSAKFTVQQNAGSVTPPAGFTKYLGCTSSSAYAVAATDYFQIRQPIEGFNVADLSWGTANAQTVTLSFWVRSSLTGTFGGAIQNAAPTRSYPFTYTISSANTWEQKSITIAGDTSGTWATDNTQGMIIVLSLGAGSTYSGTAGAWASADYESATGATSVVGTNGATFYITGVQLEKGSTATSFDYRPYGTELALCQRYYYRTSNMAAGRALSTSAWVNTATIMYGITNFPIPMRITPTALEQSGTATDYATYFGSTLVVCSSVPILTGLDTNTAAFTQFTVAAGLTVGQGGYLRANTANAYLGWSAEL